MFKLRTQMFPVRYNFKNKFGNNLGCDLCKSDVDNQEHLLNCLVLKNRIPELKKNKKVKYSDIFGEVARAAKLFCKISKERQKIHDMLNINIF